jgi:ABC-type transport system substrate-binding protein
VREAINYAINRQALVKVAFAGYATPGWVNCSTFCAVLWLCDDHSVVLNPLG